MDSVTVMPRERQRVRQFALALDGTATVDDAPTAALLRLAGSLHGRGAAAPEDSFRVALRQRLITAEPATGAPRGGLGQPAPWRRRMVAASAALAISAGSGAGLAVASSDALPGDRLYEVKRAIESVRLALAPSDIAKAERYLAIASTRLAEINAMLAAHPNAAADPALVEELRETMSAMAEAVAAGSRLFFEVFERTADASVLAPLAQFLAERSIGLVDVRDLLPAELLSSQDYLLGELQGLALRVASATGTTAAQTLGRASAAFANAERASRAAARGSLSDPITAVTESIEAVRAAAEAAQGRTAEAAAPAPAEEATTPTPETVQRDVQQFIEVNVVGRDSADGEATDDIAVEIVPRPHHSAEVSTAEVGGAPGAATGSQALEALPMPERDVEATLLGGLSASLDPDGARYAHLAAE